MSIEEDKAKSVYSYPKGVKFYTTFVDKQKKDESTRVREGFEGYDYKKLNFEQSCAFHAIKAQFEAGPGYKPLKLIVRGTAGSGKSFLLGCIANMLKDRAVIVAPTGVASLNICGNTVHATFSFPFCGDLESTRDVSHSDHEPTTKDISILDLEINIAQAELDLGLDTDGEIEKQVEDLKRWKQAMEDKLELVRSGLLTTLGSIDWIILDEFSMVRS
jgi:hypothetical protein